MHAGAIAPSLPQGARKIFLNVSENKSSDRKLIFRYFGIHENACDITQNALIAQLLGDFALRPSAGTLSPAHSLGAQPPDPRFAPKHELLDRPLDSTGSVVPLETAENRELNEASVPVSCAALKVKNTTYLFRIYLVYTWHANKSRNDKKYNTVEDHTTRPTAAIRT